MLANLSAPAKNDKKDIGQYGGVVRQIGGPGQNVLPAGEEAAGLGHLVAVLPVSADAEGNGSNANNEGAHDRSVGLPVARLSVPTTSGGPNFLGVPVQQNLLTL